MVSDVDLSVLVHFRFFNFVKCIDHRAAVLERSQHMDTDCTSGGGSPVKYHVHVIYHNNQAYKINVILTYPLATDHHTIYTNIKYTNIYR